MQFQSDILGAEVSVPSVEELSAIGAAYMAGISNCAFGGRAFDWLERSSFLPTMPEKRRTALYKGWLNAIRTTLANS